MKIRFTGEIEIADGTPLVEPEVLSKISDTIDGIGQLAAVSALNIKCKRVNPPGRPRKLVLNDGRGDT